MSIYSNIHNTQSYRVSVKSNRGNPQTVHVGLFWERKGLIWLYIWLFYTVESLKLTRVLWIECSLYLTLHSPYTTYRVSVMSNRENTQSTRLTGVLLIECLSVSICRNIHNFESYTVSVCIVQSNRLRVSRIEWVFYACIHTISHGTNTERRQYTMRVR